MSNNVFTVNFEKVLARFIYKFDYHRVFDDFLTACICAYSGGKYEDDYFKAIEPYRNNDLIQAFPEMLSLLIRANIEKPYTDILGEVYMNIAAKSKSKHFGQFFTPEHICHFMAQISMDETITNGKTILDPACGSGRMLLSGAKLNHTNYFFGADLDPICAKMTALNLSVNGIHGEVACMDSILNKWSFGYQININTPGITKIEPDDSFIYLRSEVIKPAQTIQKLKMEQLELQLF